MFSLNKISSLMSKSNLTVGESNPSQMLRFEKDCISNVNRVKSQLEEKNAEGFVLSLLTLTRTVCYSIASNSENWFMLNILERKGKYNEYYTNFVFDNDTVIKPAQSALARINANVCGDYFALSNTHRMYVLDAVIELFKIMNIDLQGKLEWYLEQCYKSHISTDNKGKVALTSDEINNVNLMFDYLVNPDDMVDVANPHVANLLKKVE